jgi:hypothetical protein
VRKIFRSRVAAVATGAAVVVGLGSTGAWAAATIGSDDIRNGGVRTTDIRNGGVHKDDVHRGAVGSHEVADDSLGLADLRPGAESSLRGSTGPRGPQGPRGPRGPKGDDGDDFEVRGRNWDIVDRNVNGAGDAYLRNGPTAISFAAGTRVEPPLGIGSLGIRTEGTDIDGAEPAATADKASFGNQVDFFGDLVGDLEKVGFSVFTTGENIANGATVANMPTIQFEIDPNLADTTTDDYTSMVYNPANGAANDWTEFDATDDTQGPTWFLTGTEGSATACSQATPCTFTAIQDALDEGTITAPDPDPATIYTAQIVKGRDFTFSGAVDALQINDKVYDFEPFGVLTRKLHD